MMTKVLVVPCSGIGKPFGSIGRDAVFAVVDEIRPEEAETDCLSLLVSGDAEAVRRVREARCIAVDGCPMECARKNIEIAGGRVDAHVRVMEVLRENRSLKPRAVTELDEDGRKLSELVAARITEKLDSLKEEAQ